MKQSLKKPSFASELRTGKERMTAQKSFVFGYLKSVKTHPSAEVVYKEVRKKLPSISQGTVYRVLNNFKDKGEIQAIEAKDVTHFDADISDHAHFICERCGNVFDVISECSECGLLKNKKTKVGLIKKYTINFYGICKNCRK